MLAKGEREAGRSKTVVGNCACVSHSVVSDSCDPMDCSPQAPLSMEFSKQEYWSGLPFHFPRELPDLGIEPRSPHCRQILYCLSYQGSPKEVQITVHKTNKLQAYLEQHREYSQYFIITL